MAQPPLPEWGQLAGDTPVAQAITANSGKRASGFGDKERPAAGILNGLFQAIYRLFNWLTVSVLIPDSTDPNGLPGHLSGQRSIVRSFRIAQGSGANLPYVLNGGRELMPLNLDAGDRIIAVTTMYQRGGSTAILDVQLHSFDVAHAGGGGGGSINIESIVTTDNSTSTSGSYQNPTHTMSSPVVTAGNTHYYLTWDCSGSGSPTINCIGAIILVDHPIVVD